MSDHRVIGVAPDISELTFIGVLKAAQSPALSSAHAVYQYAVKRGVAPGFVLALFAHESGFGKAGTATITHSWGNTRLPTHGGVTAVRMTTPSEARSGQFPVFRDWIDGGIATVARLVDYAPYQGKTTAEAIVPTWAPASDGNDPGIYVRAVVAQMAAWQAADAATGKGGKMAPIVAISAGHHNTDGGDAFEVRQTGPLAKAVGDACKALGMGVVYLTGNEGMAMEPVGLQAVARKLNGINPRPAIYLETHTEGGGGTGVFAIYPDAPGDVDTDVRDNLGPAVARKVAAATGLGIGGYGKGVISEKQTGVGGQGFRLGIFGATEPSKADVTRLIIEYGAHDKEPDLTIVQRPGFYAAAGKATAEAFAAFLGWQPQVSASIGEALKDKPAPPALPPGYMQPGTPDTYTWKDAAGVIVYRKVRYYQPQTDTYYDAEWSNSGGETPFVRVG